MYQIDNSTAAVTQPASTPAGSAGFFTDGNPAGGTAATIVPAEWLNAVMMELVNVVTAGGLTPTKNTFDQVAKAIKAIGKQRVILNDTGAVNAYAATNSPALLVGTWLDGIAQSVKITNANTGPSTYSPDGLTAIPIYGLGLQPLQGGELRAGGVATMVRFTIAGVNSGNPICVLLDCFGGAQQVGAATASNHAVQLGQVSGVVGTARNLKMSVTAASPTATLAADEIVVETSLGGLRYCLSNFSRTINLATTGVGGMDVGSAPVSGYVALYAIYNPSNGAMGLLAVNATGAVAPNIYAGANMPVGYTASALVSAWQTNGSGQFVAGLQIDRRIGVADNSVLTTSSTVATPQALSIASAVPPNAKFCSGTLVCNNTVPSLSGTMSLSVYDSDANTGGQSIVGAAVGLRVPFSRVAINTPQTIRWSSANNSGSPTFIIVISSYEI